MSTILVLAPVIAGSWPVYASLVTGVALSMGYNVLSGVSELEDVKGISDVCGDMIEEVGIESTHKIVSTMKDGDSLKFTNGKYELTFVKDARGMCACRVKCAAGTKAGKKELQNEAKKIINKTTQAYVYNKLKSELANKGYNIIADGVTDEGGIKITLRKWQ